MPVPKYLIYVVEDDEDDRIIFQRTLVHQSINCSVHFFSHGADLFIQLTHFLNGRLPDIIFLDLDMPVMNGYDTLRLLKQTEPYNRIPVIIRTGYETLETINHCYELGCHAYVTKKEVALSLSRMVDVD
jgi:CheY-like chemotaxis protein